MPVSKNKRTTSLPNPSTPESSSPVMPHQQEFHQHLRALAQSAVRTVIEAVMREELDAFIGAAWGECSPKRKGYRNGHYTRGLVTSTGRLEDIKVPRDREGQFHTQAFERYSRYEPHIAEGLCSSCCTKEELFPPVLWARHLALSSQQPYKGTLYLRVQPFLGTTFAILWLVWRCRQIRLTRCAYLTVIYSCLLSPLCNNEYGISYRVYGNGRNLSHLLE